MRVEPCVWFRLDRTCMCVYSYGSFLFLSIYRRIKMPKECIIKKAEIDELIEDDFAAVITAIAEECESCSSDMGTVMGRPELGDAYDRVAAAIRNLIKVGEASE